MLSFSGGEALTIRKRFRCQQTDPHGGPFPAEGIAYDLRTPVFLMGEVRRHWEEPARKNQKKEVTGSSSPITWVQLVVAPPPTLAE